MADLLRAPARRPSPLNSSLDRRQQTLLNPIIEESDEDGTRQRHGNRADTSHLKIQAWLSPMSDHFPTPRGIHYLSAPIVPSSTASGSTGDTSPTTATNHLKRSSTWTENTEFEDIYDVSDEEEEGPKVVAHTNIAQQARLANLPPRLIIPTKPANGGTDWTTLDDVKKIVSPVPLTPSAQLTMSPAQLKFMDSRNAMEIPTISAPPSLDGSLDSDQMAAMSAPSTPDIDNGDEETVNNNGWGGVHLQPGALATLHALSGEVDEYDGHGQPEQVLEISDSPARSTPEMTQNRRSQNGLHLITNFAPLVPQPRVASPVPQRRRFTDLAKLDVPSPGGFFADLSPRSRNTWHLPSNSPDALVPPTSTTAEQFYKCPWNVEASVPPVPKRPDSAEGFYRSMGSALSDAPVEQILKIDHDALTDGPPTAVRMPLQHQDSGSSGETVKPASPNASDATEIIVDYDPNYAKKQQEVALSHLDRTESWLVAQRIYLKGIDQPEDPGTLETITESAEDDEAKVPQPIPEPVPAPKKKSVRFSDMLTTAAHAKRLPSKLARQESAYYRAFQDYIVRAHQRDVFIQQLTRFEALQAQRVSLRETHRNQLLGKFQLSVVPQSAKKRLSANVARGDDTLIDDPEKLRKEKEFEAMEQMTISAWHVAAIKFLNGGQLVRAPVLKRLGRLSCASTGRGAGPRNRARILDLSGQAACGWAWHCALQFPNAKTYTVTTKAIRQLSNSNIRGPPNHRQVAVERLTRLPFNDNHFDLISARELHSVLKFVGENGEDEWERCLQECMRVLKPGGYLEFSLLDSDIMAAGPLGLAKSVEFGFTLKTLGYDPSPSKMWLGRLARAGFQDVRRAWTCLPVAPKRSPFKPPTPPLKNAPLGQDIQTLRMNAMVMGSSDDIASVCSIVGGWSWERWLLRCEMEKVAGNLRLDDTVTNGATVEKAAKCLDGVQAVIEEGRSCRSGFRMLTGYAQKPPGGSEVIKIALA